MLRESKKNFLIDLLFFITVAAIIYVVFRFLAAYLLPFVIGLIIAALVQKPSRFISKHTRVPKGICSVLFVLLTFVIVVALISLLIVLVYNLAAKIGSALPEIINEINETWGIIQTALDDFLVGVPHDAQDSARNFISELIVDAGKTVTGWLPGFAASVAFGTPEYLVVIIVTVVASCYIAKDFEKLKALLTKAFKKSHLELIYEIKDIAYTNIFKILKSYLILMAITFVELSVGLLIMRIPSPFLIAGLIAFVDLMPVLGCGTVLIPWGIIALIQGNFLLGAGLLILYVIILVVRNIIEPKIVGDQVGMHPLITLLAIFVGFRFIGVLGIFVVPVACIIVTQLYKRGKLDFLHFSNAQE